MTHRGAEQIRPVYNLCSRQNDSIKVVTFRVSLHIIVIFNAAKNFMILFTHSATQR